MSRYTLVQIALTAVFVIFVIASYQPEEVFLYLGRIPVSSYALALALLVANQLLSSARFHLLLRDAGGRQSLADSHRINIVSILGGVILFNYFGQSITRSTFLGRIDRSPAVAFILTGVERGIALVLLVISASASALFLFGGVSIEFDSFWDLLFLTLNLAVVVVAVILFGVRRERRLLRGLSLGVLVGPVFRMTIVTLTMLVTMLGAYVVLASEVAPSARLADLIALSAIVMLAAAVPISFSGWGIRELTAAYAFGAVGLDSGAGLTMAVAVGFLSLAALAVNLIVMLTVKHSRSAIAAPVIGDGGMAVPFTKLLCWTMPLAVAMLVVFQVRLPTTTGFVTVNLADGIVIIGAFVMATLAYAAGDRRNLWQAQGLNASLGISTVAISLGFLHGWVVFGITDWALYNRLLGWLVLICYLLTGALVTTVTGRIGRTAVFRTYVVACATVVTIEFCMRLWGSSLGLTFLKWSYQTFYGMIGNPNALAFQLLLALGVGLSGNALWVGRHRPILTSVFFGVLVAGVWLTGSRSAVVTLICIALLNLGFGTFKLRRMIAAVVVAVIIVSTPFAITHVRQPLSSALQLMPANFDGAVHVKDVTPDRARSIVGGWEMFKRHPFFGAGLGAFMHAETSTTGTPLVIHSSYLWLLAEIGLVGFLACLLVPGSVLRSIWLNKAWKNDCSTAAVLSCLFAFAAMSLTHDLAYQRAFWLLIGAALAVPNSLRVINNPSRIIASGNGNFSDSSRLPLSPGSDELVCVPAPAPSLSAAMKGAGSVGQLQDSLLKKGMGECVKRP